MDVLFTFQLSPCGHRSGLRLSAAAAYLLRRLLVCKETTMPSADFCIAFGPPHSFPSLVSKTACRPPGVSSTTFSTRPPDLQRHPLMTMDFVIICSLVRVQLPCIRFLFVGSWICSTLLSDAASRRHPCASLHFTVIRLCKDSHLQLLNMPGTQKNRPPLYGRPEIVFCLPAGR